MAERKKSVMKFVSAISHFKKRNDMQQKFNSPDALSLVAEFHRLFKHPILLAPAFPPEARCKLRVALLEEELKELKKAIFEDGDLAGIADAFCDLQYVLSGAILEFGMGSHFQQLFHEVQRSNMSKAAKTEDEARQTVERYFQDEGVHCHIEARDGHFFVYRDTDKKTVKAIGYSPAALGDILLREPDETSDLNSTEAIAGFMAWILSPDNKEPVLTIDNAPRLISTFAASQDLPVTRENWRNFLKPMPSNHDDEHSGG
jgi:hypothetical protein